MDSSEQAPSTPPKRRHWLIVSVILVLVSTVAWWNWPRGDARFLGKWACHDDDGPPSGTLELWSSGRGVVVKNLRSGKKSYLLWSTTGDTLRLGETPLFPRRLWLGAASMYCV